MDDSLERQVREGEAWAEKRLREGSFTATLYRHAKGDIPSSRVAETFESLKRSFGAAYALQNRFSSLVESKQRGVNKQAIVAYETANGIVSKVKPWSTVKLTTKEKEFARDGDVAEYLLDSFVKDFKGVDLEGFIKGEQGVINYVTEHFHAVRNAAEKGLPQYLLKEDLFGNRVVQEAGSSTDASRSIASPYKSNVDFSDYMGSEDKKRRLERQLFQIIRDPEKWRSLVKNFGKAYANVLLNIVLEGETGTGKSYFCKAVAGELDIPVYFAKGSDFVKKYIGEGKDIMEDLYRQAASHGIGMVVIEEADVIGISRDHEEARHKRDVINTWLTLMQEGVGEGKVVTMINTNRFDEFDAAIRDRIPAYNQFRFEPLAPEMIAKVLEYHIGLYHHEGFSQEVLVRAASMIDNGSLRGLPDMCYLASCYAMERDHKKLLVDDLASAMEEYRQVKQVVG